MVSGYVQNFKKREAKDNYTILNWRNDWRNRLRTEWEEIVNVGKFGSEHLSLR